MSGRRENELIPDGGRNDTSSVAPHSERATIADILAGTGPTHGAAPEDVPDPELFASAFWVGAAEWSRRAASLPVKVPGLPAPPDIGAIRAKAEADSAFCQSIASLEALRVRCNPTPDRFRIAFSLGVAAAANEFANRIRPSEWRARQKHVETALQKLDALAAIVDTLDSDVIHGPPEIRTALGAPSSQAPRDALRVLREWIELNRPDPEATKERETTLNPGLGKDNLPAWPLRKMSRQLTGLLEHMLGDPCTDATAQIIWAFTGVPVRAKHVDTLRR